MEYVKSPFNYIGGKYKLLGELLPLFPHEMQTMVDVFGGGFNVGVNTVSENVVYNDQLTPLVELMEYLYNHTTKNVLSYINETISEYGLCKSDKGSFNTFRAEYNQSDNRCPLDLYVLIAYSFNHQIRFNNKGEYNSSHGTNRSSFTKSMENNLIRFMGRLHDMEILFYNKDFTELEYTLDSFCYFDPPYYISNGSYNDGNRGFKNWTLYEEKQLYRLLTQLDSDNVKWGLSNVLVNKGETNRYLEYFIKNNNYNLYYINSDYSNSNYQKKNKTKNVEVYMTNI